jgi:molecular chaperone DnaK
MVKEAEQFADEDKKRRGAAEAKNNAESLIHSTEKQLAEHGDKVSAEVKEEIEKALAEAKTAVEGGDTDDIQQKTAALTQSAMKLGQAMYEQQQAQQAQTEPGGAEAEAGEAGEQPAGDEEVVDAEFSEVDEENKG